MLNKQSMWNNYDTVTTFLLRECGVISPANNKRLFHSILHTRMRRIKRELKDKDHKFDESFAPENEYLDNWRKATDAFTANEPECVIQAYEEATNTSHKKLLAAVARRDKRISALKIDLRVLRTVLK